MGERAEDQRMKPIQHLSELKAQFKRYNQVKGCTNFVMENNINDLYIACFESMVSMALQ